MRFKFFRFPLTPHLEARNSSLENLGRPKWCRFVVSNLENFVFSPLTGLME